MNALAIVATLFATVWIDGKDLPIEGRGFTDTAAYYDRLPACVSNVSDAVKYLQHNTAGMQFRFATDSNELHFKWIPYSADLAMDHMPASGVSGIDVYRFDEKVGEWRYLSTGRVTDAVNGATLDIGWNPGEKCIVNLPLYNGIKEFSLGIADGAKVEPITHAGGDKPVVFYGTSITQGGCASRPGMAFVNIVGRKLDMPIVNLGFSGSGVMEYELSDHIARIDASCYVIDSLWNMWDDAVKERYEAFVRNIRARRPNVPIVLAEQCDVYCCQENSKDRLVREIYERFLAEGWEKIVYLPKQGMFADDFEGTVDGCHPNDYGMICLAKAFTKAVATAIGK